MKYIGLNKYLNNIIHIFLFEKDNIIHITYIILELIYQKEAKENLINIVGYIINYMQHQFETLVFGRL